MTVAISVNRLPYARVSSYYQARLTCTGGGPLPLVWSLTGGSLPDGLQLTPAGAIFGTPKAVTVNRTFLVTVQDGQVQSDSRLVWLDVVEALTDPANPNLKFFNDDF